MPSHDEAVNYTAAMTDNEFAAFVRESRNTAPETQVTEDALAAMSPGEINKARREGRLERLLNAAATGRNQP